MENKIKSESSSDQSLTSWTLVRTVLPTPEPSIMFYTPHCFTFSSHETQHNVVSWSVTSLGSNGSNGCNRH